VVEQLFRVEWMLGGEAVTNPAMPISQPGVIQPTPTLNPYENDQLEYQLELRNFGNGGDNITISGHSQDPRLTIEMLPTTLSLQQEETGFVTLRVTVPQGLQHGDYLVMANLSSQEPGYTVRVFLLEFTVLHYDVSVPDIPTYIDPDEGDVTVPDIVVPSGTDMLFKLVVGNNGTIPLSDVVVRGFDSYDDGGVTRKWNFFNHTIDAIAVGDQFLLGTQPSSNKNPSLSWTATRGGVHIIEFVVYHDHQADTSNDASSVTVTVDESPVVTVTSKDDRVKRGETLTITGTVDDDQGNVQWVRVRVDGGAWMDANGTDTWSFELETEGLAVGEHTLEVVAFDGLSESTLYNMTIRIDRMYSADDSPGPGLAATILVISLVASVMTMYRRAVRKGV
jgi:hypothetical protein